MRTRSRIMGLIAACLLLAVLLALAATVVLVDRRPLVDDVDTAGVDDAVRTRTLVKRAWRAVKGETGDLVVTEDELNSAFAFVARGTRRVQGRAHVGPKGLWVTVTVRGPATPFGSYLNIRLGVAAPENGLRLRRLAVGGVDLPGAVAQPLARVGLDWLLGNREGTHAFEAVRSVRTSDREMTVVFDPVPDLRARLVRIKNRFKRVRDSVSLLGDPADVGAYYAKLIEVDRSLPPGRPVSLAVFLPPLFRFARDRGGDPVDENEAAVLALAIFLGSGRFESFVGTVRTDEMRAYERRARPVTVLGRVDLRLHFLVSAGLKVISDSGVSHAVGEFKELMDARWGGSGFSFVDLAADRAGVRFADGALAGSGGALRFQESMAGGVDETALIPDARKFPEGLTRKEFQGFFHDVESPAYLKLVSVIDRCVDQLPLYRRGSEPSGPCNPEPALPAALKTYLDAKSIRRP